MKKNCFGEVDALCDEGIYKDSNRKREQDFTRNRKMTFRLMILFTLFHAKVSTQTALERFLPELKTIKHMSQQAFSAARELS
jgi:hypothetical protein